METRYKLTNADRSAHHGFVWPVGECVETSGEGELCGPGWTHWYESPEVAVFMNPIHANFDTPICWRGEVDGKCKRATDYKEGWTRGRLIAQVPLPAITIAQRVEIAIRCSLQVQQSDDYIRWVNHWLSGEDRSENAAAKSAEAAANAAAWAAKSAEAAAEAAEEGDKKIDLAEIISEVLGYGGC